MNANAEHMYKTLEKYFDNLPPGERIASCDILRTYCWYSAKVDECTETIDRDGDFYDTPRGLARHPAAQLLHQYSQRKSDYYSKLMKALKAAGSNAVDELEAFVRGA